MTKTQVSEVTRMINNNRWYDLTCFLGGFKFATSVALLYTATRNNNTEMSLENVMRQLTWGKLFDNLDE